MATRSLSLNLKVCLHIAFFWLFLLAVPLIFLTYFNVMYKHLYWILYNPFSIGCITGWITSWKTLRVNVYIIHSKCNIITCKTYLSPCKENILNMYTEYIQFWLILTDCHDLTELTRCQNTEFPTRKIRSLQAVLELFKNKKVLLGERKRHTARRVASTPVVLSGGGGGYPIPGRGGNPSPGVDRLKTLSSPTFGGGPVITMHLSSWCCGPLPHTGLAAAAPIPSAALLTAAINETINKYYYRYETILDLFCSPHASKYDNWRHN